MGLWSFAAGLGLLWAILHAVNASRPSNTARPTAKTTFAVSGLSFHLSTSALNGLPAYLLWPFRSRKRRTSSPLFDDDAGSGTLGGFWDVGAFVGVVGVGVAQLVLLWAAGKSVWALWDVLTRGGAVTEEILPTLQRLIRRSLDGASSSTAGSAASQLVLRPVIPGLTMPLSSLPLVVLALFASQSFHELGHALAAASGSIPLLATGIHFYVLLPTFYVSLAHSPYASPCTNLRVATAGVWHNLVLVAVVWLLGEHGVAIGKVLEKPWFREVGGGVVVVGVDSASPLYSHLRPYNLVTHLNDVELDSSSAPTALWASYLTGSRSTHNSYDNLGWCLPLSSFSSDPGSCCIDTTSPSSSNPSAPSLCFALLPSQSQSRAAIPLLLEQACLDPLPLFPPSHEIPARCLSSTSCDEGLGCAKPREDEMVLRIRVDASPAVATGIDAEVGEGEGRTVVWQGRRQAVLEQVSVSDVVPRYWWVPLSWPRTIERFYSHVLSLSLALAFFNLLPLPHLDGSSILLALVAALATASSSSSSALESGLGQPGPPRGALEKVIAGLARILGGRFDEEGGRKAVMRLEKWTVGVLGVLVVASVVVEVSSARGSTAG